MKQLYLLIIVLFSTLLFSQERVEIEAPVQEKEQFSLYPNPAFDDIVYIKTKTIQPKIVMVYDIFGKMVLQKKIRSNSLNISSLVPGVYLLRLTEKQVTMTRKLVVK